MLTKNPNFEINYVTLFVSKNSVNGSHADEFGLKSLQKAKMGI